MTRSRNRTPRSSRTALITIAAVVVSLSATAAPASAGGASKTLHYRGLPFRVPVSWPVFRLGAHSHVCVRFNRHAVYLGMPGAEQICPQQAIGRTEAILVSPAS